MKQYIGTKIIEAEPAYRCMDGQGHITITDDPSEAFPNFPSVEDGYRVRYADGYVSWSPKETFEKAYLPLNINEELGTSAPSIGAKMVDDFIAETWTTTLGDKTTVVRATALSWSRPLPASARRITASPWARKSAWARSGTASGSSSASCSRRP